MTNHSFKTGGSRVQPSILPARVEDYVDRNNPVRAIDAFVDGLELERLGFRHAGSNGGAGQPPYDPADLLKLYLYGYVNRVRSSRSLEREAGRNLEGRKPNGGRIEIRYVSRKSDCDACALRLSCVSAKTPTRTVYRWEHEAVLDRHRARMKGAEARMRRRAELAEHPFGTLKCRAGYRHFLVRGFDKVRGEWSLMALCYNFSRVLSILGLDRFMAYLAERRLNYAILLLNLVTLIVDALQTSRRLLRPKISPNSVTTRLAFNYAL